MALRRLQIKIIEVIREIEEQGEPFPMPMNLETTNHSYRLDFEETRRQFRLILVEDEEA